MDFRLHPGVCRGVPPGMDAGRPGRLVLFEAVSQQRAAGPIVSQLRRTRAQQESIVRWLYRLAPVLLSVYVATGVLARPHPGGSGVHLVVTVAIAGFVLGVLGRNVTATHPGDPAHYACVSVLLGSALVLLCVQPDGPGAAGVLLGVLCVARLLPRRLSVAVLLGGFAVLAVVTGLTGHGGVNLIVLSVLGVFYGLMLLSFRLSEANKQAERLLSELEAGRAAKAQAAGIAERQRLAREVHDVLAHSLSGLMLQLEGARMLAAEDPADPRLPGTIDRAHHLARAGMAEARRAIGMLRDDDLPGPERLPGLAEQFEQNRQVPCRVAVIGPARELAAQARLAIYRVAQEALTNITKHARPDRVELRLSYEPTATRLVIEDYADLAPARTPLIAGSGYGLTGMRERAELLGASLRTASTDTGFRVELEIPT